MFQLTIPFSDILHVAKRQLALARTASDVTFDRGDRPGTSCQFPQAACGHFGITDVCFTPESGVKADIPGGPSRANTRHQAHSDGCLSVMVHLGQCVSALARQFYERHCEEPEGDD